MNSHANETERAEAQQSKWRPLTAEQQRVAGVLIEKAKTTPDAYPMTLNSLVNGCNQKSNRCPQMQLTPEDVEEALTQLREMGAVAEVQGGGRVPKYRHYLYEWLGVEKAEMAVMAELLLRGEQTVGELRGRASRMEPIPDLDALRPILQSLTAKGLVVALTPEGRGQVMTHTLHQEHEMNELRGRFSAHGRAALTPRHGAHTPAPLPSPALADAVQQLQRDVHQLRTDVDQLRHRLDQMESRPI